MVEQTMATNPHANLTLKHAATINIRKYLALGYYAKLIWGWGWNRTCECAFIKKKKQNYLSAIYFFLQQKI